METVKVSSKGQIVIPKSLRETHHIRSGDKFIVTAVGDELRLKPASAGKQSSLKAVAGMLRRTGAKKPTDKQIEARIAATLRKADEASKSR